MGIAIPLISRQPVPKGRQAVLNEDTHLLRIAPGLPGYAYHVIILEAIMLLNGRRDLTTYAHRPHTKPDLRVVPRIPQQRGTA